MIIACPACSTRYVVPDTAIGVEGRTVRCAKCRHSWFQDGPESINAEDFSAAEKMAPAAGTETAPPSPAPTPAASPEPEGPEEPEEKASKPKSAPAPHSPGRETEPPRPDSDPEPEPVHQERETPVDDVSSVEPEDFAPPAGFPEPPPREEPVRRLTPIVYEDEEEARLSADEYEYSSFDHEPPFRPRRNIPKLLMIAAIIFAVLALAAAGWVWRFGLPGWVPVARSTFAQAQAELVLDFPPNRQDRRTLPNGTEFFGASGTVTNIGSMERSVPSILIVMRDARERIVYSWEVVPPKNRLSPGESVNINEAVTDVPKSAVAAEIGWKPG